MSFFRDLSVSAVVAGFVIVLVGFTSTGAVVFQAAQALQASPQQTSSWMWALGWGMGLACIIPSLRYRAPVVAAWSTPGAALIATGGAGLTMAEGIGAFLICGALITLAGVTRTFERMMDRIPMPLAAALLAGVLLRFGMDTFISLKAAPGLVLAMCAAHLCGRRWWPRYSVVGVLIIALVLAGIQGTLATEAIAFEFARPVWTSPQFSIAATVGLAVPLFVVTMASQNMPGIAVMRSAGYSQTPVSPVIASTGIATLAFAPFGAFTITLAAITAAIAMGPEAHEDPKKRYTAAVVAGAFYCLIGTFGAVVGGLFAAFPRPLIVTLAGLALLSTIGNGLATAMKDENHREAAIVTFLFSASGVTLLGIGSAFWGIVAGVLVMLVSDRRR
jgi:benzoate membrane transport protein